MATSPSSTIVALIPAPSGYHVDFENPQRRGVPACYWITAIGLALSTSFIVMRVYTKVRIVRDFKLEDWCIVLAYAFSVSVQAILFGLGFQGWIGLQTLLVHIWEESIQQFNYFSVLVITSAVLYVPCLGLAKFSLLVFYYRMSLLRWLRFLSVVVMVIIIGYSFSTIFALIFPCKPIAKAWDVTITEGSCINRGAVYIMQAVTNIVTDIVLLLLPIPIVWKLQMPVVQKIGLVLIFVVGSLTCVTSIVRLVLLMPTLTTLDQPWAIAIPSIWIGIEANLVIICCSLPAIRLFIPHFAPKLIGEYGLSRTRPSSYDASANTSNPSQLTSKIQGKMRSRLSYGKVDNSNTSTDVELQSNYPKVWTECYRGSTDRIAGVTSHLDDPTPPCSGHDDHHELRSSGIVVTKTFG